MDLQHLLARYRLLLDEVARQMATPHTWRGAAPLLDELHALRLQHARLKAEAPARLAA